MFHKMIFLSHFIDQSLMKQNMVSIMIKVHDKIEQLISVLFNQLII